MYSDARGRDADLLSINIWYRSEPCAKDILAGQKVVRHIDISESD